MGYLNNTLKKGDSKTIYITESDAGGVYFFSIYINIVMVKIISIEGNIGAGKSTFIETSKQVLEDMNVVFLPEPVDEWGEITDRDGEDIITQFYKDQEKHGFTFQMLALVTRAKQLKRALLEHGDKDYIIIERSVLTDKEVFCKMLYEDGKINDIQHQVYLKYFRELLSVTVPDYYLYLKATPSTCLKRIHRRKRAGEHEIMLNYLHKVEKYHYIMLNNVQTVVSCDMDIDREGEQYEAFVTGLWNHLLNKKLCDSNI